MQNHNKEYEKNDLKNIVAEYTEKLGFEYCSCFFRDKFVVLTYMKRTDKTNSEIQIMNGKSKLITYDIVNVNVKETEWMEHSELLTNIKTNSVTFKNLPF